MTQPPAITWHDEIDSTNEAARRLAAAADFQNQWIAARRQNAGRGRLGRAWESPSGNLFATALTHVPGGLTDALKLPFAAALAVHDTVVRLAGRPSGLGLKWPNDVRHEGRKLSGILVESGEGASGTWAAVGIGVNLAQAPQIEGVLTACVGDLAQGAPPEPEIALAVLAEAFETRRVEAWRDFAATRDAWSARAEGRDSLMRAQDRGETLQGLFDGLDSDGGLILRLPSGVRRTIRAGDVELVRRV